MYQELIENNWIKLETVMANRDYSYHKKLKYMDDKSEYVFQLKKRNLKWSWLLLMLPLFLLFIRCNREIDVSAIDSTSGKGISNVDVSLSYTAHYLYKDGKLFHNEYISRTLQTDTVGNGTFSDLPCSVFSYVFYLFSRAEYTAKNACYTLESSPEYSLFHYTWHKNLMVIPKTVDLDLFVVDRETEEALAGTRVIYQYELEGQIRKDTITTEADGRCTLHGVPECGDVILNRVSCYGYADTVNVGINVPISLTCPDSSCVKLTPLKQKFTYFVKNKYTEEPIPGATVRVILTSSNGLVIRGKSVTNVDGKGFGAYEDAFVLADLQLRASKRHYKDGQLEKQYSVEQFAALPDRERTVYLEPEPYMEQFQNVDSISGVPITGVNNLILVTGINGQNEMSSEISNKNGIFYIKAMEKDRIDIESKLNPYYKTQQTHIDSFGEGEIIKMQPKLTDLKFRTVDGETEELLSQCVLSISSSISNISKPTNSDSGEFTVKNLRVGETISIVASKTGYTTNSNKVRDAKVIELMHASQERRDIPLFLQLPPCSEGGDGVDSSNRKNAIKSYNMGMASGRFLFDWETYSIPDRIQIYNCKEDEIFQNSPIFDTGMIATSEQQHTWITFSNGPVITVVGTTSSQDGSSWKYYIHCP